MTSRPTLPDIALAALLTAVGVLGTLGADRFSPIDHPVDPTALTLVITTALLLTLRRLFPITTLLLTATLTSTYLVLGYPYGPILLSFLVAAYTAARHTPLRRALPAAAAALVILLIHVLTTPTTLADLAALIPGSAWVAVPFAVGVSMRQYREGIARSRTEAIRRQVDAERLRLAQEVHDVVGHGLAAIKMQAEVALHLLDTQPTQAEVALTAISRTATEALDEVRTMVNATDRSPTPGLARLPDLRDRMTNAGMQIDLDADPTPPDLAPATDLTCYRVVQESLTNALRHSLAKRATVRIRYEVDVVVINVSNPATRPPGPDGLGIPGMRKRVAALGGHFAAGPANGTFTVQARIPREAQHS